MRRIKFRTWEPESEMGKHGNMSYDQDFALSQILHPDGCIVMQFTGLLDKRGKEIYEGDIVRYKDDWGIEEMEDWESAKYITDEIFFDENRAQFYPKGLFNNGYWPIPQQELEVIGNIYENPELLTEGEREEKE